MNDFIKSKDLTVSLSKRAVADYQNRLRELWILNHREDYRFWEENQHMLKSEVVEE